MQSDIDLFGHLLEYQKTDEFKQEAADHREQYLQKLRPLMRAAATRYRKAHSDHVRMREQAHKYRKELYEAQKGICFLCGKPLDGTYEIDHKKPLIKGGTNDRNNLCLTHRHCNRKKWINEYPKRIKIG